MSAGAVTIRPVADGDAAAIAAIYAWYVDHTPVTFEEVAPDAEEIARRIAAVVPLPYLVAEAGGALLGYAYARPYHPRAAYRWTCETSIYLATDARGRGVGRPLYTALLEALTAAGLVAAMALITEPNMESVGFHERLGFRRVGLMPAIGYKHGAWHGVGYWQRDLAPRAVPPAEVFQPL